MHYRHTQFGTLVVWLLGGMLVFEVVLGSLIHWHWVVIPGIALMALLLVLFHSLTVDIDHERIRLRFGWGPIGKTYPVSGIKAAREVKNSWLYGWGIRYTPHGWLYNISGFEAVEIEFEGGKKVRIGTDEPAELVRAVRRAAAID